ncbi:UvrD-helicase domain-containing protein [Spirillospora sp. NPDC127200]
MSAVPGQDPALLPDANLLVVAPPGCGKTELLARRAEHLIAGLEPHQRILALTFSNRAKANLAERLRTVLGAQRFRRYIKVTNFHGHAAELIRAHGRTIGLDPTTPMPVGSTLAKAISAHTDPLQVRQASQLKTAIEGALSEAKREARDDDEVGEILDKLGVAQAVSIELHRREEGVLHYDDLLRHAQRLLRVEEVAALYQQHFGAVLVDEFQDLSLQQLDIALRSTAAERTFVGDPLQGIYSWAGARPVEVETQLRELCGEPRYLSVSYRSSPAVLTAVNNISSLMGGIPLTPADPAAWPDGGFALASTFASSLGEAEWIKTTCTEILEAFPTTMIGIIARAGWRRRAVDEVFAHASNIRVERWDLALDDTVLAQQLVDAVARLPRNANLDMLNETVLAGIEPADVESRDLAIEALADFADLAWKSGSLAAAAAQLRTSGEGRAIGPGVHILNAHTGKGQQFDWVFVPGLEGGHIPSFQAETAEQIEEELRVLLVILSRARHGIVATRSQELISKAGRPYNPKVSPWWDVLANGCPAARSDIKSHLNLKERARG